MTDNSANNKRIAKNTLLLYIRMFCTLLVSLYTSRVVLKALGFEDFGIYNVVAGFVTMLAFLNNSLSLATQRFLTVALGRGDAYRLKEIFSQSVIAHLFLGICIFVIAEVIGLWFLYNKLNLPPERFQAAFWVFQCSLLSTIVLICCVPYNALIIIHEKMSAFAYISIFEVSSKLLIAYGVQFAKLDKLITYAILLLFLQLLIRFLYSCYSKKHFDESSITWHWNKKILAELTNFASWTIIGNLATIMSSQGLNMLLNVFFGPVVNAARGIAVQIEGAVVGFAQNIQLAINPQIMKTYAIGNLKQHVILIISSAKYCGIMLSFISIPILIELQDVLTLWLEDYPDHTINFVGLIIITGILNSTVNSAATSINATGKIKSYQILVSGTMLLVVPICFFLLKYIRIPEIVFVVNFIITFIAQIIRLLFVRKYTGLPIILFLKKVYLRLIICFLLMLIVPYYVSGQIDNMLSRLFLVFIVSIIYGGFIVAFIALEKSERVYIYNFIRKKMQIHKDSSNVTIQRK